MSRISQRSGRITVLLVAAGLGLSGGAFKVAAQFTGPVTGDVNTGMRQATPARPTDEVPYVTRDMEARQLKRLREEHQKEVFNDTAKLLQLATTLKAEADKGSKPTPGVMKDVDEIGKLAKRVSERIKTQ